MLSHGMPTLGIVGAGRVGRALGRRLHEMGWRVGPVVTRGKTSARAAVRAIGEGQAHVGLTHQVLYADVLLIATPDDALPEVAAQLAEMGREEWHGKIVLHTSGAISSEVLDALKRRGAETGSLHPLQTFSGREIPPLEGCFFAMEGSAAALRMARRICRELNGIPVRVPARGKAAYHAAGSFVAAFFLASIEAATRILMAEGFTRRQALRALEPLARQTLENVKRLGARAAWTGPIGRGDFGTVERHIRALAAFPPEYGAAYKALGRLVASLLSAEPRATLRALDRAYAAAREDKSEPKGERVSDPSADSH
ncbi:MAG: Rossmann-like and DUF2520 domain-containing protein [Candidatus Acidiferrales bacterium]